MLAAVPATSAPFAGRIDAGNVAVLRPGGLDGIGGIGDWALTNGALCAVVSDPGHESDLSTRGGMLVDLGRCGGNDDQWILLQPLVNFSQDGAVPIQTVRAKALPGAAWLTVGGEARGLSLEIRYELDLEHPERLRIATRVLRAAAGERLYGLAHIVLHTEHALRPFSLVTGDLAASRGFRHAAIDVESPFSVVRAAHVADLLVLVGAGRISRAWPSLRAPSGSEAALASACSRSPRRSSWICRKETRSRSKRRSGSGSARTRPV
jgi:hypothetical protein